MTDLQPPPYLSPSSIATFQQCPLKFKFSRIDKLPEDPSEATLRGNFVHDVLEEVYKRPPEQRTLQTAKEVSRCLWDEKWHEQMLPWIPQKDMHMMRWTSWWCIENLWKLEDPASIFPAGIEFEINTPVHGVPVKGFVDRWSFLASGAIIVTDYKTGKTPRPAYAADKYSQLVIYAVAIEALGLGEVEEVELLFLKDRDRLKKKVNSEDKETVVELIVSTRHAIDKACSVGDFSPKPSRLCDWCSFKNICPYWTK